MLLTAKILNSDASVNTFIYLSSLDFLPGNPSDLVIQLWDPAKNLRYVAGATATLKIFLNQTDGTELEKTASVLNSGDRSIWKISLSAAETEELLSGNFRFELDVNGDASVVWGGQVANGIRSVLASC